MSNVTSTAARLSLKEIMSKHFRNLFADDSNNLAQVIGYESKSVFFRDGECVELTTRTFTVEITYVTGETKGTHAMSFRVVREYLANNGFYNAKVPA